MNIDIDMPQRAMHRNSDERRELSELIVTGYVQFLRRYGGIVVILLWLGVAGGGGALIGTYFSNLSGDSNDLPADAPSVPALAQLTNAEYWKYEYDNRILVTVEMAKNSVHTKPDEFMESTKAFCRKYEDLVIQALQSKTLKSCIRLATPFNTTTGTSFSYTSKEFITQSGSRISQEEACPRQPNLSVNLCKYPTFDVQNYWSENNLAAILDLHCNTQDGYEKFNQKFDELRDQFPGLHINMGNEDAIWNSVLPNLQGDLLLADSISIPTAILLLCYTLNSIRYAPIPILSIAMSTLGAFLIMGLVASDSSQNISDVSPNMIMVLAVSLSVDYNLFFFSRWREEMRAKASINNALIRVLLTAGHTILVSGVTLLCCCWTLWLIPLDLLSSLGTSAIAVVSTSILMSLTLIPALVATFPNYFVKAATSRGIRYTFARGRNEIGRAMNIEEDDDVQLLDLNGDTHMATDDHDDDALYDERVVHATETSWYRFGKRITTGWRPHLCVLVIALVCGAMTYPASTWDRVDGLTCLGPANTDLVNQRHEIGSIFGYGRFQPYQLVLVPQSPDVSLQDMEQFAREQFNALQFDGAFVINARYPSDDCATANDDAACFFSRLAWDTPQDEASNTTVIEFSLNVEVNGVAGTHWLENAREHFSSSQVALSAPMDVYIAMGASTSLDVVTTVYSHFPISAGVVAALVIVLMTISFRSIVIAIKSVVTLGITLSLVYGSATIVYQYGIFGSKFVGLAGIDGLCWVPPVLMFPLLIGFGLDYHIFLISRVVEFRKQGYSDRDSVLLGLAMTGRLITFAGIIMAVAFLGNTFAHEALLAQMGFIVVVAVLLDTFVIRAIIVPSMMSILGKNNWWPRRMVEVTKMVPGDFRRHEL